MKCFRSFMVIVSLKVSMFKCRNKNEIIINVVYIFLISLLKLICLGFKNKKNKLSLLRIEKSNVEAFRYYLLLESGQF